MPTTLGGEKEGARCAAPDEQATPDVSRSQLGDVFQGVDSTERASLSINTKSMAYGDRCRKRQNTDAQNVNAVRTE